MPNVLLLDKKKLAHILRRHSLEILFSKRELDTYRGLVSPLRKRDWLAGRIATKWLLGKWLKSHFDMSLEPNQIEIINGKNGAPGLRVLRSKQLSSSISISISHEDGVGVGAVALNSKIGVDFAKRRVIKSELQQYYLSSAEQYEATKYFGAEGALLYWTIKEAYLKALGKGFMHSVADVSLIYKSRSKLFQIKDRKQPKVSAKVFYKRVKEGFISTALLNHEAKA